MGSVSIVIPTLNAASRLPGLVSRLREQTVAPLEILVVDSSSEDGTADLARNLDGVTCKVIDRTTFNHGITRHKALLDTSGEFVCFLTDDAIPANAHFLENLLAPMEDSEVALVSGRQLPKDDARRFEQLVREFNYPALSNVRTKDDLPKYGIKTFFATDACSAYRRSAYLEVGGFERVNTNEDMLIAARFISAGYKVAYAADAEVKHSHNLTPGEQFKRNREVGSFLEEHADDLAFVGEVGEGANLAKQVTVQLLKEKNFPELFAFGVDCIARFAGNRAGRRTARKDRRPK